MILGNITSQSLHHSAQMYVFMAPRYKILLSIDKLMRKESFPKYHHNMKILRGNAH